MEMNQTTQVNGQSFENKTTQTEVNTLSLVEVTKDKDLKVRHVNKSLSVKSDLGPAGTYSFDSESVEREKGTALSNQLNPVFETLSGVEFDIIAMSCYAQSAEGDWKRTFDELALRYPEHDLLVAEYSAQKRYVNDLIHNAPHGKGRGSFIWEPTRHREALFDQGGWNTGGGLDSNFVGADDMSVNQGQTAPRDEGVQTRPRRPRLDRGGRYDANAYMDLYPLMSQAYGNAPPPPAGPGR